MLLLLFFFLTNVIISILYIYLARKFKIYDKPNYRSSHNLITLNGGGILFPISFLIPIILFLNPNEYINLIIGTILIASISFIDDLRPVNNLIRFSIQSISVLFFLNHFDMIILNNLVFIISFVLITGILNSYNFMDGINGLNGLYSLTSLVSLYYLNSYFNFTNDVLLQSLIISILIFLYLNFRKKAIVFSGDIGSISMGYIISFMVFNLILIDQNIKWVLLFGIYGLDTVGTIVLRLLRKENIFQAHRSHFYQYLTNEKKISHLIVSIVYSVLQLILNIIIYNNSNFQILFFYILIIFTYVYLRINYEGYNRLFKNYH
tara:strand:+ start:71 stop:1030 length:960 start_codon:yes stop_codon:yes gene_type:complete